MPINDRDYMRQPSQKRRVSSFRFDISSGLNPIWVLIGLNILVFIPSTFSRGVEEFLVFIPGYFLQQPWTIVTCLFLHADIWHLFFNMLMLLFFGRTLLFLVSSGKFMLIYFIGGILGNLFFWVLNPSASNIALMGASGAVYALGGALVVLVPRMTVNFWGIFPMPLWVFVVVFMLLFSLPPFGSIGIAWQAHIGGLIAGLIAGYIFRKIRRYNIY